MAWLEVSIKAGWKVCDRVSDMLISLGANGVVIDDPEDLALCPGRATLTFKRDFFYVIMMLVIIREGFVSHTKKDDVRYGSKYDRLRKRRSRRIWEKICC